MSESEVTYCRLCAEHRPKEQLICKEDELAVTSEIITKMLWINIDISTSNALPNVICLSCFHQLEKTYTFLHKVRTAQHKLSIIFSRKSNNGIVQSVENIDVAAENVAKPVDEDWESFQVTKKQIKDENKIKIAFESNSIDDSNLLQCNVNVVKQEIHSDDGTPLSKCNIDIDTFNPTDRNLPLHTEDMNVEQTALSHYCTIKAENDAKPINKDWESFQVIKKEFEDENQIDTDPESSSVYDTNLVECNVDEVKQEIHSDNDTPLGECNIDTDTFNPTNRDLPLHTKSMNVEQTALLHYCIIKAKNDAKPVVEDWESIEVIKKEFEDENQIETDTKSSSVYDTNLFECNVNAVKEEIHSNDNTYLVSKTPKTNAERCKNYYKRNQAEKRNNTAERVRAHRLHQFYSFPKMTKTNAERCKDYYKRNQAEKRKKTAERVRAYRLRQKIISEQSGTSISDTSSVKLDSYICVLTPGPSRQPAPISSNEIFSNNIANQVGDNTCDSSLCTPAHDHHNIITVQPEVHMENSPRLCNRRTKKVPLTSAERTRRWREKKKEKQQLPEGSNLQASSN